MSALWVAIAARPDTPPPALAALASTITDQPATLGAQALMTQLLAHPRTPDSAVEHLLARFDPFAGEDLLTWHHAPADRVAAAFARLSAVEQRVMLTRRRLHPAAVAAFADRAMTTQAAALLADHPASTATTRAAAARVLLTGPRCSPTQRSQAITAATRCEPAALRSLAGEATAPRDRALLGQYALTAAAQGSAAARALRLSHLLRDAEDGSTAARQEVLSDPGTPPDQAATLLLAWQADTPGAGLVEAVERAAHLDGTPAAYTAAILRIVGTAAATRPVRSADDALTILAASQPSPADLRRAGNLLELAGDPAALDDWWAATAHYRGALSHHLSLLLHPATSAKTRAAIATTLASGPQASPALVATARAAVHLSADPAALLHAPAGALTTGDKVPHRAGVRALTGALAALRPLLARPSFVPSMVALADHFPGTVSDLVAAARAVTE